MADVAGVRFDCVGTSQKEEKKSEHRLTIRGCHNGQGFAEQHRLDPRDGPLRTVQYG